MPCLPHSLRWDLGPQGAAHTAALMQLYTCISPRLESCDSDSTDLGGGWPCSHISTGHCPSGSSLQFPYSHSSPLPGLHTRQQLFQLGKACMAPGCSNIQNLARGSHGPVLCLIQCMPCWGPTGATPGGAQEHGTRIQGVEPTMLGGDMQRQLLLYDCSKPHTLALWACDGRGSPMISELPGGLFFHCLG